MKERIDDGWLYKVVHVAYFDVPVPTAIHFLKSFLPSLKDLDLKSADGVFALLDWWFGVGRFAYKWFTWEIPQVVSVKLMREMSVLEIERNLFLSLWLSRGADSDFVGKVEYVLFSQEKSFASEDGLSVVPKFLSRIYASRPDLQSTYNVAINSGVRGLLSWWRDYGASEYPEIRFDVDKFFSASSSGGAVSCDGKLNHSNASVLTAINGGVLDCEGAVSSPAGCSELPVLFNWGVNVVGYPRSVFGLGEDARVAAKAFIAAGFKTCLVHLPIAGPRQTEFSMDHVLSDGLKFRITNYCLPAPEMFRLFLEGGRELLNPSTYRIGSWPWELPRWPDSLRGIVSSVDEIWAQSEFVEEAFSSLGGVRVVRMPMCVEVPPPTASLRESLGFSDEIVVFYLLFDGNSGFDRKNPLFGVLAFLRAFESNFEVGLVIKAINVTDGSPQWTELLSMVQGDSRIRIIHGNLDRQSLVNLMSSCDCFVSLHRSEGFGRVIAEAMLLGQPVIVSAFSGNMDFCDNSTAFLVEGRLVDVKDGAYILSSGQKWFDPFLDSAIDRLRTVARDLKSAKTLGLVAQERIQRQYSMEAVASSYKKRLSSL